MNQTLEQKNTWFSSDHHFGHKNILNYCDRPFSSVADMNENMIERWNSVVKSEDDVYYLGDFSLDQKYVEAFLPQLNGTIYWIPGNHDASHPMHESHKAHAKEVDWLTAHGVVLCQPEHELFLDGTDFLLCHFPYGMEDHTEVVRYPEWRPVDRGLPLLCGHIHDVWKTRAKMINVGVDQWDYYPVSAAQVLDLVENSNSELSRTF